MRALFPGFLLAVGLVSACGASTARPPANASANADDSLPAREETTEPPAGVSAHAPPRAPGPLTHREAEALVAGGLGAFLARIQVSPVLDAGRFIGFRLDAARDLADWNAAGADIRVGDVILRINGIRIERPEQGLWAFERLRIAEAIDVDVLRSGQPVRVHSPIVPDASPNAPAATASR